MTATLGFIALDIAVAALLLYAASEAVRSSLLLRASYWRLAALGLALLAFDELLGLHEAIGWLIASLGAPAPWHTSRWDDVVLACYVLIAAAISLAHLGELRRSPRTLVLLALGFGVAACGVLLDNLADARAVEEPIELAGAVLIALAMRVRRIEAGTTPAERAASGRQTPGDAGLVPG